MHNLDSNMAASESSAIALFPWSCAVVWRYGNDAIADNCCKPARKHVIVKKGIVKWRGGVISGFKKIAHYPNLKMIVFSAAYLIAEIPSYGGDHVRNFTWRGQFSGGTDFDGLLRTTNLNRAARQKHQHGFPAEHAPVRDCMCTEAIFHLDVVGLLAAHDVIRDE